MELGEPDEKKKLTEECAGRLCGTSLVIQSEVRSDEKWKWRFSVHPATARFMLEQIDPEEQNKIRLEVYLSAGTFLEKLIKTSHDIIDGLDAGHYLFQCGEYDRSSELLGPASDFIQNRGYVRLGVDILEPFNQNSVKEKLSPEIAIMMFGTLGLGYFRLAQVEKAIGYYEQALVIAREIGDRRIEGSALSNLGNVYKNLGQLEKAIKYHEQALKIMQYVRDRRGEGSVLGNLGIAYKYLGQIEKAIKYHEQALVIAREIGDRKGEGDTLGNLGVSYIAFGMIDKAKEFFNQSLSIAREIKDPRMEKITLKNLKKLEEKK